VSRTSQRAETRAAAQHRLWFVLEPELGDLFLVESSSSNGDGDSSSSDSVRSGLPAWLGADIPVIPAACFAAEAALGRAHTRTLLEANCLIKVGRVPDSMHLRAQGVAAKPTPAPAAVLLLLLLLPHQDLLDPDAVAAGACRLSDVAQLVTFSSRQQAAQRAGVCGLQAWALSAVAVLAPPSRAGAKCSCLPVCVVS
jgi:hypothetical protein